MALIGLPIISLTTFESSIAKVEDVLGRNGMDLVKIWRSSLFDSISPFWSSIRDHNDTYLARRLTQISDQHRGFDGVNQGRRVRAEKENGTDMTVGVLVLLNGVTRRHLQTTPPQWHQPYG